jgi:hypothetical protein
VDVSNRGVAPRHDHGGARGAAEMVSSIPSSVDFHFNDLAYANATCLNFICQQAALHYSVHSFVVL